MMHGEWKMVDMKPCELPQRIATGFTEAFKVMEEVESIPILYCATQVGLGTNHLIICKQVLKRRDSIGHIVKAVLYENLEGKFQVISLENIL
ncbi:hypothetical protein [Fusobacterium ulcerans]|uniref:hypothetical protein n=1 Tax=Fusobacterium ulcerans TaxID=861 RepID=UPI001D0A3131|nr:hypothetical protein [Fusobacterium ulcerans]MCB8563840.1 hypothetical protein [Fusobacterium ulcerans]MCB8648320.1 hypothetical protein [Fusobacterium ulcerans]